MTAEPAETSKDMTRIELARHIKELLQQAPNAPVPFFGDSQEFRAFAGDRLVIEIDPALVIDQFPVSKAIDGKTVYFADHLIGKGPWPLYLEKLERSTVYREIADLLAHDLDYRAAPIHAELLDRIVAGRAPIRNLVAIDTLEKLDLYFEKVVELIGSIRSSGYRRRPRYNGLESADAAMPFTSAIRPVVIELMESEIGVAVGLDGRLHRIGPGAHRMAIARQLQLPRVPVEVRMFHVQWVRRAMAKAGGPLQAIFSGIRELGLPQHGSVPHGN